MTLKLNDFAQRLGSRLVFAVTLLSLAGCATFNGPGPLTVGAPDRESNPSIILNGQRVDSRTDERPSFDWPVDEARLTRGFSPNARAIASKGKRKRSKPRAHWGLDLANRKGTPILAAQGGRVVYTGHAFRGYGRLIVIEHGDEWATLYSHLDKILVKEGQSVGQGERIGLMGRTGRATGVHLHFELRHHRQPVNPIEFLPLGSERSGYGSFAHASRDSMIRMMSRAPQEDMEPTE